MTTTFLTRTDWRRNEIRLDFGLMRSGITELEVWITSVQEVVETMGMGEVILGRSHSLGLTLMWG